MGSNIDDAIRAVTTEYYDYGPVKFVESENGSSVVKNGVGYRYNALWQLTDLYQDMIAEAEFNESTGAPLNDTKRVQYLYDTDKMADGNFSRLDKTTYPDGEAINHKYGTAAASDDRISRVRSIRESGGLTPAVFAKYQYIGVGKYAEVDFEDIDVQLDFTASHGGKRQTQGNADNPGVYPGYDQFGRTVSQMWVDGDFTEHATPSSDYGNFPPFVELTYTYDKQSNRLTAYDNRPGASQKLSHEYGYDGVDRLVLAERGDWDGTTFTRQEDSQQWTLDMLGNWSSIDTDLNGNGVYNDTNEEEDRDHDDITDANELDIRLLIGQGVPSGDLELDLTYDKAGNLRTAERPNAFAGTITWTYTHDAWNRLVLVEVGESNDDRLINVYNGLNWRIIKQADTNADGSLDEQRMMYYSANWQLCEERIDDDATFPTDPDDADIDRHVQYVIGIRYIDDVILHREDNDVNGVYDDTWYHLTDVQFSTVAILDDAAALVERVTYGAYGDARHHYMADWEGDGDVTQSEIDQIRTVADGANHAIGQANYNPDMDIDGNGDVQRADYTIANNEGTHPALAKALITQSSVDNQIGYDSYVFNAETLQYTVRFRCYDPVLGRWLERDPLGYVDGMNLYEYVMSSPVMLKDSYGFSPATAHAGFLELLKHWVNPNGGDPYIRSNDAGWTKIIQNDLKPQGTNRASSRWKISQEVKKIWNGMIDGGTYYINQRGDVRSGGLHLVLNGGQLIHRGDFSVNRAKCIVTLSNNLHSFRDVADPNTKYIADYILVYMQEWGIWWDGIMHGTGGFGPWDYPDDFRPPYQSFFIDLSWTNSPYIFKMKSNQWGNFQPVEASVDIWPYDD